MNSCRVLRRAWSSLQCSCRTLNVGSGQPFFLVSRVSRRVISTRSPTCRYDGEKPAISAFSRNFTNRKYSKLSGTEDEVQGRLKDPVCQKSDVKQMLENAATYEEGSEVEDPSDVWSTPLYPVDADPKRDQAKHSIRPKIDPSKTSVILFPGQGTQFVGMGKDLISYPNVKEMFDSASQIIGYDLLNLCLNGPQEMLDKTVHSQIAILVTSLAAVEKLRDERPWAIENCVATAGFSIGEITALVFAGSITFEEAVRLVKVRAEAMQAASEQSPGGMMTVFYGPDAKISFACLAAKEWCKRHGIEDAECAIANYLFPHCKVIGGSQKALEFLQENGKQFGIKRYKPLAVSGAFHTKLMEPAQSIFAEALASASIESPLISVHSNFDGKIYSNPKKIRRLLARQICSPVKWEQLMHILYERPRDTPFPTTYECGPGRTLKTILQKVNARAFDSAHNILA